MAGNSTSELFLLLTLDATSSKPLYRQLYDGLRRAILSGQLSANTRLPSTRAFAQSLGLSRSTVFTAFEQLLAEGYVYGKVGSGTYVAHDLPEELLQLIDQERPSASNLSENRRLSQRGTVLATTSVSPTQYWREVQGRAFRPGLPALDLFPRDIWMRLLARQAHNASPELLGYTHPAGYPPLRAEIAAYVQAARGVQCDAEQVIVVSGSQQAIDLAARLLLDPGDPVWIEEPCYLGTRSALLGASARIVPVPVDSEGLEVASGIERCPQARLACVTPSHQYPLGVTMSLARRLALLQWANQVGAWILEDDYDSEYRYSGRPLSSLQGLDSTGRVIYVGTFSKVLFPGLRLGYVIVPPDLVDAFTSARALSDRQPPILEQMTLTDFIAQEHFARHVRRMRAVYTERQAALVEAITHELDGLLSVQAAEIGMHLVGMLRDDINDVTVFEHCAHYNIVVPPLTVYSIEPPRKHGLLLGYTALSVAEIRQGVQQLSSAFDDLMRKRVDSRERDTV